MSLPEIHTNTHIDLDLGSGGNHEGFMECDTPTPTVNMPEIMVWDGQGAPQKVVTSGLVSWGPVTATRYHNADELKTLMDAWKKMLQDPNGAKEEMKIIEKTKDGTDLATWTLKGAIIEHVETRKQSSGGQEVKVIDVRIKFDDAELI
jgi:hypothetical protein